MTDNPNETETFWSLFVFASADSLVRVLPEARALKEKPGTIWNDLDFRTDNAYQSAVRSLATSIAQQTAYSAPEGWAPTMAESVGRTAAIRAQLFQRIDAGVEGGKANDTIVIEMVDEAIQDFTVR